MKPYKITNEYVSDLLENIREQIMKTSIGATEITYKIPFAKTLTIGEKAEVHFDEVAYHKMKALINNCEKEIAWDGVVSRDEENSKVFWVEDIIVYPQEITATTVDTDDILYPEWLNSLDDDTFNRRRFNGHSHVRMGCTPSGTDRTYRDQSITNVTDFFIYGIFNKTDAHDLEIIDVENNIIYSNADIDMFIPVTPQKDWALEEMKKHITEKKYAAYTPPANAAGTGYYGNVKPTQAGVNVTSGANNVGKLNEPTTTSLTTVGKENAGVAINERDDNYWKEYWEEKERQDKAKNNIASSTNKKIQDEEEYYNEHYGSCASPLYRNDYY